MSSAISARFGLLPWRSTKAYDDALKALSGHGAGSTTYAELRGDVLKAQGKKDGSRGHQAVLAKALGERQGRTPEIPWAAK